MRKLVAVGSVPNRIGVSLAAVVRIGGQELAAPSPLTEGEPTRLMVPVALPLPVPRVVRGLPGLQGLNPRNRDRIRRGDRAAPMDRR